MKKIMTIVALVCAVTFQVNAQNTVEEKQKAAEAAVKLADKNPEDGLKQYAAAGALADVAAGDNSKYEQALAYAHKALKIAQAHKERKDTLLANTYSLLGTIYMMQGSMDNACDFMELSVDATEEQLGRYDPLTIYNRLKVGLNINSIYPDTRRGFLHVMQAFYDNEKAPANKRIKNLEMLNIMSSMSMEQMMAAYTNSNRYGVLVVMMDGKNYFVVQTRDWHIGQPLVNWLTPNILRSEAEKLAHRGEGIILMNDDGEFRRLTKEEGEKLPIVFPQFILNPSSREVEIAPGASHLLYLQPDIYNETVRRFEEFINKK